MASQLLVMNALPLTGRQAGCSSGASGSRKQNRVGLLDGERVSEEEELYLSDVADV